MTDAGAEERNDKGGGEAWRRGKSCDQVTLFAPGKVLGREGGMSMILRGREGDLRTGDVYREKRAQKIIRPSTARKSCRLERFEAL